MNRISRLVALLVLFFVFAVPARAQQLSLADLQSKLTASWIATVEGEKRQRVLVVDAVAQKGDGVFLMTGTFNFTDVKTSPFKTGEVQTLSGNTIVVFTTGAGSVYTGSLQADGAISGTVKYTNGQSKPFKMEKGTAVAAAAPANPGQKFTGTADPNLGITSGCSPNMRYEVTVKDNKVVGKLQFSGAPLFFYGDVKPDGSFETSYQTRSGATINVWGKVGDSFSIKNPTGCGYGGMALKS